MSIASNLRDFFPPQDIEPLLQREDLFRCTRRDTHGSPYQVLYIDESDAWLHDDVEAYLEAVLSDDYYGCQDYLQWNFYYYILSDQAHATENKALKQRVEQDESFARKIVLTPQEFLAQLSSVNRIGKTGAQLESGDLYNEWLDYLFEKGLHFVYEEKQYPNYKAWVDQYVEGKPFEPPADEVQQRTSRKVLSVAAVGHLSLKRFRRFPEQRAFQFGKVNLIFGPNASGKTSFFDALELCFTGVAKGAAAADYQLEATTSSHGSLDYPAETGAYRQRDIAWYKSVTTRGHNLSNNFNKFNYYASDAAFLLQADNDQGNSLVESTITDIALGREINRLEERISEFRNRFHNRHEELKKIQHEQNLELQALLAREETIRQEDNDPAGYRQPVTDFMAANAWQVRTGDDEEFIVRLDNAIRLVADCLEKLAAAFPADRVLRKHDITNRLAALRQTAGQLAGFKEIQEKADETVREAQKKLESLTRLLEAAEQLPVYFADPDIAQLESLNELISQTAQEVDKTEKAAALLPQLRVFLSLQPDTVLEKKFADYHAETLQLRNDTAEVLSRALAENERVRRGVEQLTAIVADIKRLGLDFLEADHQADHCPLCQRGYTNEELTERITASAALLGDADYYTLQRQEITRLENIMANCNKTLEEIDQLETAIPLVLLDVVEKATLQELRGLLEGDATATLQLRETLARLRSIKAKFEAQGLSFDRFSSSKAVLEEWSNQPIATEAELTQTLADLQQARDQQNELLQKLQSDAAAVQAKATALFDRNYPDEQALQRGLRSWQQLQELSDQIGTVIRLGDDADLFKLRPGVQELSSLFMVYRTAWQDRREQTRTLKELAATGEEIKGRKVVNDRLVKNAKNGYDLLHELLTKKNKRSYLVEFIQRNKTELVEIFRLIHAPSEFTDISFDNQKISLLDTAGKWHGIHEVSTGQRTAIAISLFLSLNQKLSAGPNVILLDDPVTYVDDLNTLSFLDYLRELVEHTDRQVFFATANADVAFLFSKKFAYLPEGQFCRFDFQRAF